MPQDPSETRPRAGARTGGPRAQTREERLAAALRETLRRRKDQSRARTDPEPAPTEELHHKQPSLRAEGEAT